MPVGSIPGVLLWLRSAIIIPAAKPGAALPLTPVLFGIVHNNRKFMCRPYEHFRPNEVNIRDVFA